MPDPRIPPASAPRARGVRPADTTQQPVRWADRPRPIVALAPMDGITDSAYRRIVRRIDRDVILFSEFTSADGFLRSEKIRGRLAFQPEEHPYFVQLFGNTPDTFAEASRQLEQLGVLGIDINMGCPAKKIVHSQHGSGLMRDVDTACRIVERVAGATGLEVSVKTRLGWTDASNLVPFARSLVSAGASLITIHGRTYNQQFSGTANWEPIYALKEHLPVPVLGNGDVVDHADGLSRLRNLDGFMIGRAAIGNPWAFRRDGARPTWREKAKVMAEHYRLTLESRPERIALLEFRKHVAEYVRGFPAAKAVRRDLMRCACSSEFLRGVEALAGLDTESVHAPAAQAAPAKPNAGGTAPQEPRLRRAS